MQTLESPRRASRSGTIGTSVLAGLLVVLGMAAVGGGWLMVTDPTGGRLGMGVEWLRDVPLVDDYLIPGWFLLVGLGLLPLMFAVGLVTRFPIPVFERAEERFGFHWAWVASIAEGVGVLAWIGLQLSFIDETHPVQAIVASVGFLIVLIAMSPGVRSRFRR